MADLKETELASAPTQQLPALGAPVHEDDPRFQANQKRIEQMIDGDAPLNDILAEPPGRPKLKTAMVLSGM